jgi:hypothetical protein
MEPSIVTVCVLYNEIKCDSILVRSGIRYKELYDDVVNRHVLYHIHLASETRLVMGLEESLQMGQSYLLQCYGDGRFVFL